MLPPLPSARILPPSWASTSGTQAHRKPFHERGNCSETRMRNRDSHGGRGIKGDDSEGDTSLVVSFEDQKKKGVHGEH